MITKIISGGQGGVEKAALDLAVKMAISHGGWTNENNIVDLSGKSSLNIMKTKSENKCVEKNIMQSDGTLALYRRKSPTNLFSLLKKTTKKLSKPFLMINLNKISKFESALKIHQWVTEENIRSLYVSGEHVSKKHPTYQDVVDILESTFYLDQVEQSKPLTANLSKTPKHASQTVKKAVECLIKELPLKDRVLLPI